MGTGFLGGYFDKEPDIKQNLVNSLNTIGVSASTNNSLDELYSIIANIKMGSKVPPWVATGWVNIANCSITLYDCRGATIGDCIYVTGSSQEEICIYNAITNTWTIDNDKIGRNRSNPGVTAVNDKLYIIGGWSSVAGINVATNACYDPSTKTTTFLTDAPGTSSSVAAESIGTNIYIFGVGNNNAYAYKFDTLVGAWSSISMANKRRDMGSTVIGNDIFLVGGFNDEASAITNIVEYYNPSTNTYTRKKNFPITIMESCAEYCQGLVYCFHGRGTDNWTYQTAMRVYNPSTDSWSSNGTTTKRTISGSAVHNDVIYSFGGYDGSKYYNTGRCYINS